MPHRSRLVMGAACAACAVTAASALTFAAPSTAAPAPRDGAAAPLATGPGGLDPDTSQRATSMTPPSSADGARTAHATPTSGHLQAYSASDQQGIDVASYQHPNGAAISWPAVRSSGRTFVFVKATESTGYANPYYAGDVRGARAAGLQVGAYHFARPAYSATAQADAFARTIATATPTLAPVLDLEDDGGLSVSALQSWVSTFLSRTEADTGVRPVVYTGPSFWSTEMGGSTAFTRYPLWVAHYTSATAPYSVGGWSAWTFWQYSDGGGLAAVPGISGAVDRNRFAGSSADLAALAAGNVGYWLKSAGASILGRPLNAVEIGTYALEIARRQATPRSTALRLLTGTEGLGRDVQSDYLTLLDRGGSSSDLAFWAGLRQRTLGKLGERSAFARSGELYAKAGGTPSGFVSSLYTRVLGRPASSADLAFWTARVRTYGTASVVGSIVGSAEANAHLVDGAYVAILGRHADSGALRAATPGMFAAVGSFEGYEAGLYASAEYFNHRVG